MGTASETRNKGNMITLNIVKAKCKGVWKWVQVAERSIYAYVLTDITSANTVKDIKVDVQKQHGLQKLEKISAYIIYIYKIQNNHRKRKCI